MSKSDELLAVEAEHGFVFGIPDDVTDDDGTITPGHETNNAPIAGTVACNNSDCERQGQQHTIYRDTVQPIICGGCRHVLMCDHKRPSEPEVHYGGTLAAPIRHEITTCLDCGSTLNHTPRPVSLHEVPLEAFRSNG